MESTTQPTSWRSKLKVHPAADLFPLMSPEELRVLGEDIKAHALLHPIQMLSEAVIDGRNRLDAMEMVGLTLEFRKRDNRFESQIWVGGKVVGHCRHNTPIDIPDPGRFVVEQNILRRHLTAAQKGELITALLKADPAKSDRAVAEVAKVDHKTVGAKRATLSATGEIPQSDTPRTGKDGKTRKRPTKFHTDAATAVRAAIAASDAPLRVVAPEPAEPLPDPSPTTLPEPNVTVGGDATGDIAVDVANARDEARISLQHLPFLAALVEFETWYTGLDELEQSQVLDVMGRAPDQATEPAEAEAAAAAAE